MTDDERREVAKRLRAYGKEFGDPTWRELCNVVFWDEDSYPTAVRKLHLIDRLADLIEPSEPKVRCVAEVKVDGERLEKMAHDAAVELTGIDRDALMALADEMEEVAQSRWEAGHKGIAINDADRADRIRKALGGTDG